MKSLLKKMVTGLLLLTVAVTVGAAAGSQALADPQPLQRLENQQKSPIDNPNCDDKSNAGLQKCLKNNPLVEKINVIVNFLSAAVGVVVIAVIIMGGIQYSIAGGSPEAVSKAKTRITNGLIALAAFLFIFAFLQWIIPGGIY